MNSDLAWSLAILFVIPSPKAKFHFWVFFLFLFALIVLRLTWESFKSKSWRNPSFSFYKIEFSLIKASSFGSNMSSEVWIFVVCIWRLWLLDLIVVYAYCVYNLRSITLNLYNFFVFQYCALSLNLYAFVALFDSFFGGINWNFLWLIEFFLFSMIFP